MTALTTLKLSQPAHRALANAGIKTLKQISKYTEKEFSKLHGMGPNAIGKIKEALKENGLSFSK